MAAVALVDDDDFKRLSCFEWHRLDRPTRKDLSYAVMKAGGRTVYLHKLVMRRADEIPIDHKNRNGLDCRKENLRPATNSLNQANSPLRKNGKSGYRGVTVVKRRFQARIKIDGKMAHLGLFEKAKDAARAYDRAARAKYGEFAVTNFST